MTSFTEGNIVKISRHDSAVPPYYLVSINGRNNFYFSENRDNWPLLEQAYKEGLEIGVAYRHKRGLMILDNVWLIKAENAGPTI